MSSTPPLSYLITHAENWAHEEDSPLYYAILQNEEGTGDTYVLTPEQIDAQDPRVLQVLHHYYHSPEHAGMYDTLGEIWGEHLRGTVAIWDGTAIEYEENGERFFISEVISINKQRTGSYAVSCFRSRLATLENGLAYADKLRNEVLFMDADDYEKVFPGGVKKCELAQSLGLSGRETAMFILDKRGVLSNEALPRDILLE